MGTCSVASLADELISGQFRCAYFILFLGAVLENVLVERPFFFIKKFEFYILEADSCYIQINGVTSSVRPTSVIREFDVQPIGRGRFRNHLIVGFTLARTSGGR